MSTQLPWYIARSAGLTAWALLTASVVWGLTLSTKSRVLGRRPRPNWMLDLHRYLGGLATIFTGVHVAAIMLDSYTHFDLVSVLVPFASSWRPAAVAWGIAGVYLLLAVELTSLARRHLSRRVWRATHFASFPLFVVATVHGITAGTDTRTWLFQAAVAAAVLVIGTLTVRRVQQSHHEPERRAPRAPARREPSATVRAHSEPERELVHQ